jgi:hypothetical protein
MLFYGHAAINSFNIIIISILENQIDFLCFGWVAWENFRP